MLEVDLQRLTVQFELNSRGASSFNLSENLNRMQEQLRSSSSTIRNGKTTSLIKEMVAPVKFLAAPSTSPSCTWKVDDDESLTLVMFVLVIVAVASVVFLYNSGSFDFGLGFGSRFEETDLRRLRQKQTALRQNRRTFESPFSTEIKQGLE
jgi:hypothetical protein